MSLISSALKLAYNDKGVVVDEASDYRPDDKSKEMLALIRRCFTTGDTTMNEPRAEFNDLSVITRMSVDQMAWNTYQSNDGDPVGGDETMAWRSRAMKPIVRNKIVSIAAHATARLIFPKIFAYDDNNDEQVDAAVVMRDLMEWTADQSDYNQTSFYSIISALINPAAIINTDYVECYKAVKKKGKNGWDITYEIDEDNTGFKDTVVPVDELYIENIYEHDIQKQGWLIWRKIQSYSLLKAKYGKLYPETFKYVKPGIQLFYNSPNQTFYNVYDQELTGELGEEIIYWNKELDTKQIVVNGVLLTDCEEPNPRIDKRYPFVKFGYELIDEGKFFYYKSLAFKMKQDADIVNTLYPMIIDGTYLNIFSPIKVTGSEAIGSDVIIPGAAITLSSPDADLQPIRVAQDIRAGMETLAQVENSINQSSQDPILAGNQMGKGSQTAYEISKIEQNASTVLGLFLKMIAFYVKAYGKLRMSDILQYMTIGEVSKIDGTSLTYKTFLLPEKNVDGKNKTRKIAFDPSMPTEPISGEEAMIQSFEIMKLEKEGGDKTQLYRVNPQLFRDLKYELKVSADVLQPTSEELEKAYILEQYDRMIANPLANQEEAFKLLLSAYPKTKGDIEKYIKIPEPVQQQRAVGCQHDATRHEDGGIPCHALRRRADD